MCGDIVLEDDVVPGEGSQLQTDDIRAAIGACVGAIDRVPGNDQSFWRIGGNAPGEGLSLT